MQYTNTQQVELEAQAAAKANEVIQRILGDINGAVKYIVDGKDQHPNRLDMEVKGPNVQPSQQTNAFGAPTGAAPATAGFGQPSGMGQQSSAFGKPAFGQPAAQTSTFGQASAFGKPSQPGFGQASAVGGGGSAFGQPSNPSQNSGFGQPSAVGGGASAFGQPSAPGQMGGGASAFGQPSAPGQSTGFGQPSQMGAKPAFGQSTFGQSSQPAFGQASKPAFGQASGAGQQGSPSPFAAAASKPSGFAQAAKQPATGFGQPSAFGAAASKPSPFAAAGQGQQQQQSPFAAASNNNATPPPSNPFGGSSQSAFGQPSQPAAQNPFGSGAAASSAPKPAFGQPTQPAASAFGQPSQPAAAGNPFGQTQPPQQPQQSNGTSNPTSAAASVTPTAGPDPSTYLILNGSQQPTSFKNQAVMTISKDEGKSSFHVYQNASNNGQPEHLWFPTGPPPAKPDTQLPEEDVFYSGDLGKELQAIYEAVASQGAFVGGVMPEVPPKREWVRFDI